MQCCSMQKTIDSVRSEVKEELNNEQVQDYPTVEEFEIEDILDKHSGNPELWSLWYPQVYRKIFHSVDLILRSPLQHKEARPEDVYISLEEGIQDLIDSVGNAGMDTQNLLNMRDRIIEFQGGDKDELTIVLTIHGSKSRIECLNGYYDEGIITVDMDGEPINSEVSSLREYESSLMDSFCGWTPYNRRPNNRFKRELYISLRNTDDTREATVDLRSTRMEYTLMEKLSLRLGFSSPYAEEPIKELV